MYIQLCLPRGGLAIYGSLTLSLLLVVIVIAIVSWNTIDRLGVHGDARYGFGAHRTMTSWTDAASQHCYCDNRLC